MSALRSAPVAIRLLLAALTLLFAVYAAQILFTVLPGAVADPFMKWVSNLIFVGSAALCAARGLRGPGERGAWLLMGVGVLAWGLGLLYYTLFQWDLEAIPVPSPADVGYLLIYPPVFAALVLLYPRASAAAAARSGSTAPSARSRPARSAPRSCSTRCWSRPRAAPSPSPPT